MKSGNNSYYQQISHANSLESNRKRGAIVNKENFNIELDAKTEHFIEKIADAFLVLDNKLNIVYINQAAASILWGKKINHTIGKNLIKESPKLSGTIFESQLQIALNQKSSVNFEYCFERINKWYMIHAYPSNDGMYIYFNDISEQKKIERALREIEGKYRILMEEASDAILVTDDQFKILEVNHKIEEMLGYSKEEFLELDPKQLIHAEDVKAYPLRLQDLKEGKPISGVRHIKRKDGKYVSVDGTAQRMSDGRIIFILRDITEKELFEISKDEFISLAAHELKTPVTTIKGYGQILLKLLKDQEAPKHYLTRMDAEITRLTELVNDFWDLSKMQAGKFRLRKQYFEIDQLVEDIATDLQQAFDSHHMELKLLAKCQVHASQNLIHQVVINLINNAIKYSPKKKKIVVQTRCDEKRVEVCVQDFGMGIAKPNIPRVFERFYQVGDDNGKTGGMGLGLYLSSEIIRLHGGEIWVESEKGKGSKFYFTLPLK